MPVPVSPVRVELEGRALPALDEPAGAMSEAERLLARCADVSARVALRLDDYVADQYVLLERSERKEFVGTLHPDPGLPEMLGEICREAGATACTYVPFERTRTPADVRPISPPTSWPQDDACDERMAAWQDTIRNVALVRHPRYPEDPSSEEELNVLLPLELVDGIIAVVHLRFPASAAFDDSRRRELEGRVVRWVHRLSLRRLATSRRYTALMLRLRALVNGARRAACRASEGRRLSLLVEKLLENITKRIGAPAAVLTIRPKATTKSPQQVERFWHVRGDGGGSGYTLMVSDTGDADLRDVTVRPPGDVERRSDRIVSVCAELRQRADEWRAAGEVEKASVIDRVVALAREETRTRTTMLLCPVRDAEATDDDDMPAVLTLFLDGEHHFSQVQKRLLLEFGQLVADAVAQARALDEQALRVRHEEHLVAMRSRFGKARTDTDLVGALFWHMGHPVAAATPAEYWGLADDAVLWVGSDDEPEVVARSGRGDGLMALGERTVIPCRDHPLLVQLNANEAASSGFEILTTEIGAPDKGPILAAYARVRNRHWLLSFPLVDPDARRVGIVDLLLQDLPRPEESVVLRSVLRRLSTEFSVALESTRIKSLIDFEQRLTRATRQALAELRAQAAYRAIVESVRDEFGASDCDLYVERDGRTLLHTTTRVIALADAERADLWVGSRAGPEPLGACLETQRPTLAHTGRAPSDLAHLSPKLALLLAADWQHERLVVPLKLEEPASWALLALRGLSRPQRAAEKLLRISGHFNARHLRHLADIGDFVQQTAAMAEAAERQSWLVDELQHSVGQPLQILRGTANDLVRDLYQRGAPVLAIRAQLANAFDVVHAARDRLAAFAKMSQVSGWALEPVALDRLVRNCCRLMQPAAHDRSCQIDDAGVQALPPVLAQPIYLRVALLNLLDNAIKYSYRDRSINVSLTEREGVIRLKVRDYGVGIPAADLGRIFQAYFRSRVDDRGAPRGGSGIGLTMVKHAVEQIHHGEVSVSSRPPRDAAVGDSAASIVNIPHTTTFTIVLYRNRLEEVVRASEEPPRHD